MQKKLYTIPLLMIFFLFIGEFISYKPRNPKTCYNCNIILISIDTLRQDYLGAYNPSIINTSNLNTLAKKSIIFNNAYATAPWTLPSHTSMLGSDYPYNLGIQTNEDKINPKKLLLQEYLKKNGYYTKAISGGAYVHPFYGFSKGFDSFESYSSLEAWKDASTVFPKAISFIGQKHNKKFFLFLHTFEAHEPFNPPEEYSRKCQNPNGSGNAMDINVVVKANQQKPTDKEGEFFRCMYSAEISYIDMYLGKLFDQISRNGLSDNTIIAIVSDHGEEFGERGFWALHGHTLYNELLHVPFILYSPKLTTKRITRNFSFVDLAPSLLEVVGIAKPHEFKGESYTLSKERPIFAITTRHSDELLSSLKAVFQNRKRIQMTKRTDMKIKIPTMMTVIDGKWKLTTKTDSQKRLLFNLATDPSEKDNVSARYPDITTRLLELTKKEIR